MYYDLLVSGEARDYLEDLGFSRLRIPVQVLGPNEADKAYSRDSLVFIRASNSLRKNKKLVSLPVDGILDPVFPRMNALDFNSLTILRDNDTAIVLSLSRFLSSTSLDRSRLLIRARLLLRMAVKKHVRVILTSGAKHPFDLRTPYQLKVFGQILGLTEKQAERAISSAPEYLISRKVIG